MRNGCVLWIFLFALYPERALTMVFVAYRPLIVIVIWILVLLSRHEPISSTLSMEVPRMQTTRHLPASFASRVIYSSAHRRRPSILCHGLPTPVDMKPVVDLTHLPAQPSRCQGVFKGSSGSCRSFSRLPTWALKYTSCSIHSQYAHYEDMRKQRAMSAASTGS
jgi:hypothetical protein